MRSIFTDKVSDTMPLPEYPRPQLVRDGWQNLNGLYDYKISDSSEKKPNDIDGKILVPFAPECFLSKVEKRLKPTERLWYFKKFSLNDNLKGKSILLHFGAVDWECKVYINDTFVGSHIGGYCAFTFDITDFLRDGENELSVCVFDPTDSGWQQRGKQVNKTHGFWYTATSGIWQTVWLEAVDSCYIRKLDVVPDIDNNLISIDIDLSAEMKGVKIKARIMDGGSVLAEKTVKQHDEIKLRKYEYWSPENPKLYDLFITVSVGDKAVDSVKSYFGMRKFSIGRDKKGITRLFLNNEPYFQKGLLDQGYWCDGGLTAPTDEAMIFDISEMKRLGFNMLRKHIKVEPMRWYYHCDRLGMLVWQDMVSGGAYIGDFYAGVLPNVGIYKLKDNKYNRFSRGDKKWRRNYYEELEEMIKQLYSVTSIYCWVPFNEAWGQFDALKVCDFVRSLDSHRVIDHASGWYDQGGGDIDSMHKYILPIHLRKSKKRAFVVTEFGGYSNIVRGHTWNEKKAFGYLMFKSKESLTKAYKKLLDKQIIPIIDKGLSGTVYTQVSDVENEVNGIYTYDRAVLKIDENVLKDINSQLRY